MRYLLFASVFFFWKCDGSEEFIKRLNDPPYFLLDGDRVVFLEDSAKLDVNYEMPVVMDPNENLSRLIFDGQGSIFVNERETASVLEVDGSNLNLRYKPNNSGLKSLKITVFDDFNSKADLRVDLTVFDNFRPLALFTVEHPDTGGLFERVINASVSKDPDLKFGGGIEEYEYTFLGIKRKTGDPTQTIIFPKSGTYQIILRVKDNDGAWSDSFSKNVII